MTNTETTNIDVRKLLLKPAKIQNGELDDFHYDPHLAEERLRKRAGQPGSIAITTEDNGKRYVDIIAKLKSPGQELKGITYPNRIGDLIVTGTIEVDQIPIIRKDMVSLKAATEIHLHLYNSLPATHCDSESLGLPRFLGLNGAGVVVGVVDFGCDFRHANFRDSKGNTRLLSLWDQTQDSPEAEQPAGYGYGREFTTERINQALQAPDDEVYARLGYTPTPAAHGTHVMDIAAGNGREPNFFGGKETPGALPSHPGVAPKADLVFVHLRTFDEGFLGNSSYLLDAVDYIFKKAGDQPAVVNLSLSTAGGPHDGTTLVEEGFAALVKKPGRAIVISAGNSYLKEDHLSGKVGEAAPQTILWHTDPRNVDPRTTKNEMEVWYPGDRDLQVTLTAPNGKELGPVDPGETFEVFAGSVRVGRISNRVQDPTNGDNQIDIRLPHLPNVPGPWKIELSSLKGDVDFQAWIEQDDHGLSRFEGPTDPHCTLASISCSDATLTVGAFDTSERACLALPFEATSAGPTRPRRSEPEGRHKPDLSAPGVNIVAARAQKGTIVMSGTSMAAAHVTGLVALLYDLAVRAGKGPLDFDKLRRLLIAAAKQSPALKGWDPRLGEGRIDGFLAVDSLVQPPPIDLNLEPGMMSDFMEAVSAMMSKVSLPSNGHGNSHDNSRKIEPTLQFAQKKLENGEGFKLSIDSLQ